jgi:hypothetical protein
MLAESEIREENGHVLLEYSLIQTPGKLSVEYRRTPDYFLEMFLFAAMGLAFILGGISLLNAALVGHINRSLYSIGGVFLFLVAVIMLARSFTLLRDGFRKIDFAADRGVINVVGCTICHALGSKNEYLFADCAGFRLNRFIWKRHFFRSPETVFEIVLVLQNGDVINVFPYFKTQQQAEETLQKLTACTGIISF